MSHKHILHPNEVSNHGPFAHRLLNRYAHVFA